MRLIALVLCLGVAGLNPAVASAASPVETTDAPGTYTVRKGDSFYGICYKLGVSSEELLRANPGINAGVRVGQVLTIPGATTPTPQQPADAAKDDKLDRADRPAETGNPANPDEAEDADEVIGYQPVRPTLSSYEQYTDPRAKSAKIIVALPFMLNQAQPDKRAATMTDFYKGVLVAADTMRHLRVPVQIVAYDTEGSLDRVRALTAGDDFASAAVVVGPDDPRQLALLADSGAVHSTYVFNALNVRDSAYLTDPYMLQSYMPTERMLERAVEALAATYPDATPVVLSRDGARDDKADFIAALRRYYTAQGRTVLTVTYSGVLTVKDLESLPADSQYVLVPASGSSAEFSKIAQGIQQAREEHTGNSSYQLWGYPDWTAFRGTHREQLHRLNATVYTRFYTDPASYDVKGVLSSYAGDFGGSPIDAVPMPMLLGYDVATYLIDNLQDNNGEFVPSPTAFYGVQSSFSFVHPADSDGEAVANSGMYNNELYIIRFQNDGVHTERLQ